MGRGSSKASGGASGGKANQQQSNPDLFQELQLQYDANGRVSAQRLDAAAQQIGSMTNLGDSIIGQDGLSYVAYIKMGNDNFVDAGDGSRHSARQVANVIAYFGNNGDRFSIKPMQTYTFLDHFGNRQHAIILDQKPTNLNGSSRGSIGGYDMFKIGNSSITRSNYDYIAVKR